MTPTPGPAVGRFRRRRLGGLVFAAWLAGSAPAFADWHFAPFFGIEFGGETTILDLDQAARRGNQTWGGTVTWLGDGVFGVEGDFGVVPGFFQREDVAEPLVISSRVVTFVGNVVVAAPKRWTGYSLRPYASGGVGVMRVSSTDSFSVFPLRETLFAVNAGGGVVGFVNENVGLKWDLRYFKGIRRDDEAGISIGDTDLSYWRASMAVVFRY